MPAPAYSPRVRALFAEPRHAGDADGPRADVARGDTRIVLAAELDGTRIRRLAFRVFGCPHLIAAAEAACADFEGRDVADLAGFRARESIAALGIPVEKTGRILLLEDAIRALCAKIAGSGQQGGPGQVTGFEKAKY